MTYTLTRGELIRALMAPTGALEDGTFTLVPGWIGNVRTWHAERVSELSGYEVGTHPAVGDWNHSELTYQVGARYGVWTDPNGAIAIDRTVHVRGTVNDALAIGAHYSQACIWDWNLQTEVPVIEFHSSVEGI